jgi:hypothetical protein
MTNSPKSIEQLKDEAYVETRRQEQQLFQQILSLEQKYKIDRDEIANKLTDLWNKYHKDWIR